MRVLIVGAGEVGSSIAASLADAHEVTVLDVDGERVETLTYTLDVLAVQGDGTDLETLRDVDVADTDLVIASTDDDETNVVTCGTVQAISDAFTVARVKQPKYLTTWRASEGAFGVDFMVCTDLLSAETIVAVIGLPAAQDVETFADGRVRMAQFEVPAESPVADQTVSEADRFENLTFAAIVRDETIEIPRGETQIRAGDELVVIGSPEHVRAFGAEIAPGTNGPRDVVIVGGGEIGYQTARLLESRGFHPRLIERDGDRARWLAEALPDTTVMESDATDVTFLEREHVGDADVVVTALESDEQNLLASLLARRLGAKRTVAIVESVDYVDLFETVGIDVAVNPREATAEEITRFTRERRAENLALIEGHRAEVLEIEVDEESVLAGRPIRDAVGDLPAGVVVGAITRAGELVVPRGDTRVELGDHIVVFVEQDALDEVTALL